MSATLSTLVRPAVRKRPGSLSRLLSAYCDGIGGYFFRRSAVASLNELDDRMPRDIGLERSKIEAAVYGLVTIRNRGRM